MTVELIDTRKVAVITWSGDIKGAQASIEAAGQEKRNVTNDGETNLFFPLDFAGDVEVTVRGSHGGVDSGVISVL